MYKKNKALLLNIVEVITVSIIFFSFTCLPNAKKEYDVEHIITQSNSIEYIHLSLDDVYTCFSNLGSVSTYSSLYDEPLFDFLKNLHDAYGAKFSLYTYTDVLKSISDEYAHEFAAASDWLKLGFHSGSSGVTYTDYATAKNAWESFVEEVKRITGTTDTIDRMPRLEFFSGGRNALLGMRDANYGALGFLSADDSRISYYFTAEQADYLYSNDHFTNNKDNLVFVATDMRADWFKQDFSTSNIYNKPSKLTVYEELVHRITDEKHYNNSLSSYIFFAHEWQFYNGTTLTEEGKAWFKDVCRFANDYNVDFDFSQNRTFTSTSCDVSKD